MLHEQYTGFRHYIYLFNLSFYLFIQSIHVSTCMSRHLVGPGVGREYIGDTGGLARADIRIEHWRSRRLRSGEMP